MAYYFWTPGSDLVSSVATLDAVPYGVEYYDDTTAAWSMKDPQSQPLSSIPSSGLIQNPLTSAWEPYNKEGYVSYIIPPATSGIDNKYEYINSLIAQGATYVDGSPVTQSDDMWGRAVYVPEATSNPQALVQPIDYNPSSEPFDPIIPLLLMGGVMLATGGLGAGLFGGAEALGGATAAEAAGATTLADLYGAATGMSVAAAPTAATGSALYGAATSAIPALAGTVSGMYDPSTLNSVAGTSSSAPTSGISSLYEAATGSPYPASLASNTGGTLYNAATGGSSMDWIDRALNWAGDNPERLISGALNIGGSYLSGNAAQDAAQTAADAQIQAARIAADAAKFRPVGVTTRFGNSNFVYDANGNLVAAGYGMTPDVQAQQNTLMGMTPGLLAQYQGAQAATAPMGQAAGTMMSLGNQYLATDPIAQAQKYYNDQQAIMAAQRERDVANALTGEFNRGTYGLATGGTSTGMMAANPRLEAMYNAQRQQDLQAAAQATQGGMDYAKFGAGMVGSGGEMLNSMYGTQSAARGPWDTAMGGATYLEGLAQQPMDMGINIGAKGTAANAQSGMLMSQGMTNAAKTMQPANAYSPWGSMLSGAGNAVSQYTSQQQQQSYDPGKFRLVPL